MLKMYLTNNIRQVLFCLPLSLAFISCGGGGGGDNPLPATPTYTIGGTVTGLSGIGLFLQNKGGDDLEILANGTFEFSTGLTTGQDYDVTEFISPSSPDQQCDVQNGQGVVATSNVDDIIVTCVNLYKVSGMLSGLANGKSVTISVYNPVNGDAAITVSSNVRFDFQYGLPDGTSFEVTIDAQPQGQTCTVANGTGTFAGSDVTDVSISCVDNHVAIDVDTGYDHTCAVLAVNHQLKCWGGNGAGQLGLEDVANRGSNSDNMGNGLPYVDLGTNSEVQQIATGQNFSCALLMDGNVKCWGDNLSGVLGTGDSVPAGDQPGTMGDTLPVINLGSGRTAIQIAAGAFHVCAVLDNGSLKCWGSNGNGELGLGDTESRGDDLNEMGDMLPVVDLGSVLGVVQVKAGSGFTCAVLENNLVKCWGSNAFGQLGGNISDHGGTPGSMGDNLPFVDLGTGRLVRGITTGTHHACAVLDNNLVKCWGSNQYAQLGLGEATSEHRGDGPDEMGDNLPYVELGGGRTVRELDAGNYHTCARLYDDTLKCWGRNNYGQLGQGDRVQRGDSPDEMGDMLFAVDLGANQTIRQIAAGASHTCVRLLSNDVKCWGLNQQGQLGLGDMNTRGDGVNEMGSDLPVVDLGTP